MTATRTERAKSGMQYVLGFEWFTKIVNWLVHVSGIIAGGIFLLGGIWIIVNANLHVWIIAHVISESQTIWFTGLATSAYIGLPDLVLFVGGIVVWEKVQMYRYNRADTWALTWAIVYGIPVAIFIITGTVAVAGTFLDSGYVLPSWMIFARGMAAFFYGVVALFHDRLGENHVLIQLQEKDTTIAIMATNHERILSDTGRNHEQLLSDLQRDNAASIAELTREIDTQKQEIASLHERLSLTEIEKSAMKSALNKSRETALQAISQECIQWINSGCKTTNPSEIARYTGYSKKVIDDAIARGILRKSGGRNAGNKELILMSSVAEWIEIATHTSMNAMQSERNTEPHLRIVNGD